ncbi:MAG: AraC family transcriptional regulator [Lachnospiraceae bacterium]|nr:AraC family transcriptional regulator [Lachnospiraceae bacterium]
MHYSLPAYHKEDLPSFGDPQLLFTNYCDEQYQKHPRTTHSHHGMVEIVYIIRGEGLYEINGISYPVMAGDLVIYNSDAVHNECLKTPPPPVYGLEIGQIQRRGLPFCHFLPAGSSPVIHTGELENEFRRLFQMIYRQSSTQTPEAAMICQSLLDALLRMIDKLIEGSLSAAAAVPEDSKALTLGRQLQIYVDEHALEDLSIQDISEHFEISPTYTSRVFKRATGMSLIQYIIQRRIGEAQTLLLITDLPISEVAQKVGYDNLSHFVKMFSQNVGLSPGKYRKQSGLAKK